LDYEIHRAYAFWFYYWHNHSFGFSQMSRKLVVRFNLTSRNKNDGVMVRRMLKSFWALPKGVRWESIEVKGFDGTWNMWVPKKKKR
jgi:hypothetical protein